MLCVRVCVCVCVYVMCVCMYVCVCEPVKIHKSSSFVPARQIGHVSLCCLEGVVELKKKMISEGGRGKRGGERGEGGGERGRGGGRGYSMKRA